jgi:biotin synthase-related radical SAM superfamily protein
MDMVAVSTSLSKMEFTNKLGAQLFNLGKDVMEQKGEAIQNLMKTSGLERSVNPHIGGNVDVKL